MPTLKIFFHDSCFDGAASAAIFADFYRQVKDPAADVKLVGMQHTRGDPFADIDDVGDDSACVDFRFTPRVAWWFDHHVSAFQPATLEAEFLADTSGQKFFDPKAKSCSAFEARVLREQFGWRPSATFEELIYWADIIDGAQFETAAMPVELSEPALKIMTWLEHNRDEKRAHELIFLFGNRPLSELCELPWIAEPLLPLLEAHKKHIDLIASRAVQDRGVVHFDLADDGVSAHNKFIAYYLFPEARYTVGVTSSPERAKISVGFSPWSPAPRKHNIAAICERYGGGGHPVVGAVSLPPGELARARQIAREIIDELASDSAP